MERQKNAEWLLKQEEKAKARKEKAKLRARQVAGEHKKPSAEIKSKTYKDYCRISEEIARAFKRELGGNLEKIV